MIKGTIMQRTTQQSILQVNDFDLQTESTVGVSVIVPVYNEHESLNLLHQKIVAVLSQLDLTWEVIYIDDGSTDGSTAILKEINHVDPHVIVVVQRRNFGKSAALAIGFELAHGETLVTMDADLQDEPAEIPNLLSKLDEGYDVALGWRLKRVDPWSKKLPSLIANTVTTLMTGLKIHDMNSGLKAYRRECMDRIHLYGDMHRYIPIIAHFAGFRIAEVPVVHHERQFGYSKYSTGRFIRGGLDLVTVLFLNRYGRRPLHLFGLIGGVLFFIGFLINLGLSIEWLQGIRPIGNRPALMLGVLLILVGVQLLSLGLLAEMLVSFLQKNESPMLTASRIYQAGEKPEIQTAERQR
jgi:glycosyltransferase involved in cell wall biosynthesis